MPSPIDRTLTEIGMERPAISKETLYEDREAVAVSFPAIWHIFRKRGFDYDDAEMAAAAGWRHLRIESLTSQAALSPKDLINFVSDLVKLTIKSDPSGGDVVFDDKPLPRRLITIAWCTPGKHHVRIIKEGYQQTEQTCEAKREEPTECEIKLIPIQQR
jgi:hypothetical protein